LEIELNARDAKAFSLHKSTNGGQTNWIAAAHYTCEPHRFFLLEKTIMKRWLKAGFIDRKTLLTTDEGVPQGGPNK
jgi:hypothetical protein